MALRKKKCASRQVVINDSSRDTDVKIFVNACWQNAVPWFRMGVLMRNSHNESAPCRETDSGEEMHGWILDNCEFQDCCGLKLNYPGKAGGLLGEPLKGADKTVSRPKAAGVLLLPPCRGGERSEGAIGMGVEILTVLMLSFYPLPTPPPARVRE